MLSSRSRQFRRRAKPEIDGLLRTPVGNTGMFPGWYSPTAIKPAGRPESRLRLRGGSGVGADVAVPAFTEAVNVVVGTGPESVGLFKMLRLPPDPQLVSTTSTV